MIKQRVNITETKFITIVKMMAHMVFLQPPTMLTTPARMKMTPDHIPFPTLRPPEDIWKASKLIAIPPEMMSRTPNREAHPFL